MTSDTNNRILIIDDNPAIHEDFRKILVGGKRDQATEDLLGAVLGKSEHRAAQVAFEIDSAHQGQEGLAKVEAALAAARPYALAFVDVRMPPGWDGVETITQIWAKDPAIQIVICTAYSDYSWQEIVGKLGASDQLVILKKPFDNIEVLQLAHAMTKKWVVTREAAARFDALAARTGELQTLNRQLTAEIGEREQAQAALRISEERLARAFDACPLPTAILRVFDQCVLQANPALLAATGRTAEEIVGQPLWVAGIEASEDFRHTATARLFRGETLRRHECEFHSKSGERRRGLLWLEPFALAAGPHVLAILQDVTEQSALESQLRQAQKMEAVGHLAAGVAHDFNNLFTVIQGHLSRQLESAGHDREVADSLDIVQQAAARAAELTRQLLAFSRQQVMEKGSLLMDGVVANVSAMLNSLIPENIQLHLAHTAERGVIHGDRCSIEQVLFNLVVNARDAMPRGGEIFVSTEVVEVGSDHARRVPESRAGRFVCLEVRDTGAGMDEATLRRIFEPFFTTKEVGKGTGMGLPSVQGIVKQHDGWIEVASAPGSGTTFRIHLPQTEPAAEAPAIPRLPAAAPVRGRTVLLAEDNDDVRALVLQVLEDSDLRVIEASDGTTALSLWHQHREEIDLLLTDMIMPGGISGADLADQIHAERPELPVIYSSGYSVNLYSEDRQIRKDINYLPKPYLARQLIAIVSATLAANGGAPPPQAAVA